MKFYNVIRIFFVMLLLFVMLLSLCACGNGNEEPETTTLPPTVPPTTNVDIPENVITNTAFLGNNLYITDIGNYTGAYMEDGTDEMVDNVMMIVLKNESENALQLARISLEYSDFTAEFEATNLPAGESVVLLEKNRHEYVSDVYISAKADNVLFFQEPMSLQEDKLKITEAKGAILVENLTDEVMGQIYIYYKNSAVDLYYGGITYRAKVEAGLKPGRTYTVMTNHFNPSNCTILNVQIMPVQE